MPGSRLLAVIICLSSVLGRCRSDEEYDRLFDPRYDVDSIMENERLLKAYLTCFYDEGPCAERALFVKGKIREVLETTCGRCNGEHRARLKYILNKFIPLYPAEWDRILSIYDPDQAFRDNVEKLKQGISA